MGVNPGTIRRWAQQHKLAGKRIGTRGDWRFTKVDLENMIQPVASSPEKNNLFFKRVTNNTPAMIAVYSLVTGNYVYVNEGVSKLLGYSAKEFTEGGFPFVSSIVHPVDLPRIMAENEAALKKANRIKSVKYMDPTIAQFEYRMRHKNGSWRWLKTDGSVFDRDPQGKVLHVQNISIDITERKNSERQLELMTETLETKVSKRTEELTNILDSITDAFIIFDNDFRYVYVNKKGEEVIGKKAKDVIGKKLLDVFPQYSKAQDLN